jgi:SET domain-containing protein
LPPPAYALGLTTVADAPGGRGEGLFAARPIAEGTYIGAYPGVRLSETELLQRYPDGLTSYTFGLVGGPLAGADAYLDADPRHYAEQPGEREATSGATHKMNHASSAAANVRRDALHLPSWPWRRSRVRFFASRAIAAGEELRFDYGPDYDWAALGIAPSD